MFCKVLCVVALAAIAAEYGHGQGSAFPSKYISSHDGHPEIDYGCYNNHDYHDNHAHPKYEIKYKVKDAHTGEIKELHESRDGDYVVGYYSLHQPDGSVRSVHNHGDDHTGLHADVKYDTHHIVPKHH